MDKKNKPQDPEIVEGEILEQTPDLKEETSKRPTPKSSIPKGTSRIPWILSGLLLAFIGGIFMEPWFEMGIEKLFPGSLPAKEETISIPDPKIGQNENAIKSFQDQMNTFKVALDAQSTRSQNIDETLLLLNDETSKLKSEIKALRENVGALGSQDAGDGIDNTENFASIETRLLALEENTSNLQSGIETLSPAQTPDQKSDNESPSLGQYNDQLEGIEERLLTIESTAGEAQKTNPLPLSLATLARVVDNGQTYEQALLNVRANFENLDALERAKAQKHFERLSLNSEKGVASLDDLRSSFGGLLSQAVRVGDLGDDAGVWDKTKNWFSSLVVVRKTGEISGDDDEALLARAEMRLKEKDLPSTIALIKNLSPTRLEIMRPWLEEAQNRIDALIAIDGLIPIVFGEGQ